MRDDSREPGPDPYAAFGGLLPLLELLEEAGMRRLRRDAIRALRTHGAHRVLDLACGPAAFTRRMARAGLDPVGLDASPAMLARAARHAEGVTRFAVIRGDARRLPFADAAFDAATISLAIHEMEDSLREAAWAEVRRVLCPGGLLLLTDFTVPERETPYARLVRAFLRFIESRAGKAHPPHYRNYMEFMARGGLTGWLAERGAPITGDRRYFAGNLGLISVKRET